MSTTEKNRSVRRAGILLGVLVAVGVVLLWWLLTRNVTELGSRAVAKRHLPAFTLLTKEDLRSSSESSDSLIEELNDRYLLVGVEKDGEVTRGMVAPHEVKQWLADAVAVAIPASTSNSLGGQLRAGDVVDLMTVPKGAAQVKTFESLMVLSIAPSTKEANVITLAIPRARQDEFALAVTDAELMLTRRIIATSNASRLP